MADKTIKVKVDVETDVEPSIAQLKLLKKELKATAAGSEDFQRLQQTINDMEDAIKSARTGASNFTEVLGQLPGPIGDIGNKVSGAVNTLKQFGGLKLTDIKASFVELGKDLGDAVKGLGQLTGITKVYTVLNGALAKSFQAVGIAEGAAAAGARALSAALIATGIGALVVALGLAFTALKELVTGEEAAKIATDALNRSIESQNELLELNAKSAQNRNKIEIAQLKANGATAQKIRETQLRQAKETYETAYADEQEAAKTYNANLGKGDAETFKKIQDNLDKRQQATKDAAANYKELGYNQKAEELKEEEAKNKELAGKAKSLSDARIAERKRELAELAKGLEDARLNSLSAQKKEEGVVNDKYDKLKKLAEKYGEDTKVIEAGRAKELLDITDKYAKEEKDKADKVLQDKLKSETLALDLRLATGEIKETEYQEKLYEIRKQYATTNDELTQAQVDKEKYRTEERKKNAADQRSIELTDLQAKIDDIARLNDILNNDFAQDIDRLEQKRLYVEEQKQLELQNTELTEKERNEIIKKYAKEEQDIDAQVTATKKAEMQARTDMQLKYADYIQQFGNLLGQVAGENKDLAIAGIVIEQGAALAKVIISTMSANATATAAAAPFMANPFTAIPASINLARVITMNNISGALSAAGIVAGAVKGISAIKSAKTPGGSGGGGGSVASAGGPPPVAPTVGGTTAPQIQTGMGQSPTSQIGETLNAAQKPLRAYVVSQDIQSQTALDRRTNRAATFSGG